MKYALTFLAGAVISLAAVFGLGLQPDNSAQHAAAVPSDAELSRLRLSDATQKEEIKQLKFEVAAARLTASSLEEQLAAAQRAAGPAAQGEKPKPPMAQIATMMENPAMRDMMASQQSKAMEALYGDLIKKFDFTPEEREHFLKLLTDRQMQQVELGLKAMGQDIGPDERALLGKSIKESMEASDAKIKEFLNDEADYAAYKTYTDQQPERQQLDMLRPALARSGQPLTDEQSDALVGIMFEERKNFKFTNDVYDPVESASSVPVMNAEAASKLMDEQAQLQARVAERAAQILNPQQMEAFRKSQENNLQIMKMGIEMARSMTGQQEN